jgi:hypothetical protein
MLHLPLDKSIYLIISIAFTKTCYIPAIFALRAISQKLTNGLS